MSTKKNNPKTALAGSLQSSSTSLIVTGGEGNLFPTSDFNITIREFDTDGETVIKREIIHVGSRSGDILSGLTRKFEPCVQNDAPTSGVKTSTQVAQSFSSGAQVFQSITAGDFNDLITALALKLSSDDDETITGNWQFDALTKINHILEIDNDFQVFLRIRESGAVRWAFGKGTDENFEIYNYDDNGNYQGVALRIYRDTGNFRIGRDLECSQNARYVSSNDMGDTDLDFASKGYVDSVALNTKNSQTFSTTSNTGTTTVTYNHSLGYTPRKIEFKGNNTDGYETDGVYTSDDNVNTSMGVDDQGRFFETGHSIYMRFDSTSTRKLTGKVTAVTSTTYTVQYYMGDFTGYVPLDILAILS